MSFDLNKTQKRNYLLVACENHLFVVVVNTGKIKYIKKLSCVPSAIIINQLTQDNDLRFIISAFSHHLLFYKNFELIWAAKTDKVAHGFQLANFGKQKGLVVTINEEGWLSVLYLGAEPPKARFSYTDSRNENYEELLSINRTLKGRLVFLTERKGKPEEGEGKQSGGPAAEQPETFLWF